MICRIFSGLLEKLEKGNGKTLCLQAEMAFSTYPAFLPVSAVATMASSGARRFFTGRSPSRFANRNVIGPGLHGTFGDSDW
jgi:hypothetical protein